jgi:glutamate dehydrogenase (NADP+)
MAQNYSGMSWTAEKVDSSLREIMKHIHETALATAKEYNKPGNYLIGANIAGFLKVAKAMQAQGVV